MANRSALTPELVREILDLRFNSGEPKPTYASLSRKFQVSENHILRICCRTAWQSVEIPAPSDRAEDS